MGDSAPLQRRPARVVRRRLGHVGAGGPRGAPQARHAGDRGAGQVDPHRQRFARHRLRPVDQPLPRLRARLRVLLCAANAQLPQPVAWARFRDAHRRQGQCRRALARDAGQAQLRAAVAQPGLDHRLLSAGRAAPEDHSLDHRGAERVQPRVFDVHQIGRHRTRPRPDRPDGRARAGGDLRLDHDARSAAGSHDGTACRGTSPTPEDGRNVGQGRCAGWRQRLADDPVSQPARDGAHPPGVARCRRHSGLEHRAAPAVGGEPAVPAVAEAACARTRRARDGTRARDARWQRQRSQIRHPHDGHRCLGPDDSPALRQGQRAAGLQPQRASSST